MTVHIVSAIYGGFDQPNPTMPQSVDCTWTMFTDNPDLDAGGWDVVHLSAGGWTSRMAAKRPKLWPWRYLPGDTWIWVDGAFEVGSARFVEEALAATEGFPLGQWRHPWRGCVYAEAEAVSRLGGEKFDGYPAAEQAHHYLYDRDHPGDWGLWATGLIVYRMRLDRFADAWWAELARWGHLDQMSQAVVLRDHGLRPVDLPGDHTANPWMRWHPHRRIP